MIGKRCSQGLQLCGLDDVESAQVLKVVQVEIHKRGDFLVSHICGRGSLRVWPSKASALQRTTQPLLVLAVGKWQKDRDYPRVVWMIKSRVEGTKASLGHDVNKKEGLEDLGSVHAVV
eukprot:2306659-Prymnesium_polylepis.1